jgi:hypothetical protein
VDKTKSGLCLAAGLDISSIESLGSVITVFFLLVWICKTTLRKNMQQLYTYIACNVIKLCILN